MENQIKRAQRLLKMDDKALAERLGVHRSTITRGRNGGGISRLCSLLLDQLISEAEQGPATDDSQQARAS